MNWRDASLDLLDPSSATSPALGDRSIRHRKGVGVPPGASAPRRPTFARLRPRNGPYQPPTRSPLAPKRQRRPPWRLHFLIPAFRRIDPCH